MGVLNIRSIIEYDQVPPLRSTRRAALASSVLYLLQRFGT